MKLTVAIPVMGQLEDTKGVWGSHLANIEDKKEVEILVIDNGSTDDTATFLDRFIFPAFPDHRRIHHDENIGVVASMNEAVKEAKGDVIAILHNDLYVFEEGWDMEILSFFDENEKVGLAGFLGAQGCGKTGGRMNTMSNMIEAEVHGDRIDKPRRALIFDGMSLIGRRTMFDAVGGFDTEYAYHHFYDRDISLASHFAGYENWVVPILCHHRSGVTANRPEYQQWIANKMGQPEGQFGGDKLSYDSSEQRFISKWSDKLPLMIQ